MNGLTPLNKVFGSERLRFLFGTLKPSETHLSWMQETSKTFSEKVWSMELRKFKMVRMIDFFTKPLFKKCSKNNPTKGVVLKLANP